MKKKKKHRFIWGWGDHKKLYIYLQALTTHTSAFVYARTPYKYSNVTTMVKGKAIPVTGHQGP
jgi:hypothetical protein